MRLADAVVELDQSDQQRGYMATLFASLSLPYRNPNPEPPFWETRNGNWWLRVQPGLAKRLDPKTGEYVTVSIGYPSGLIPRLVIPWLCTEVVLTDKQVLELGPSLADWMRRMDMHSTSGGAKGSITRLRDQIRRLFSANISAEYGRGEPGLDQGANLSIASMWSLDWGIGDDADAGMLPLRSTIRLTDTFYEMARNSGPYDIGAIKWLKDASNSAPMCLDVYYWLNSRLWKLPEPQTVTWEQLLLQFGSNAKGNAVYKFQKTFRSYVDLVQIVYRDAKVEFVDNGIRLFPSLPHVPMKGSHGLRAISGARR